MKAATVAVFATAILLAAAPHVRAQRPPPAAPPPPAPTAPLPPAPAALSVPDPFAGLRSGPRDLYRSPDGSDRFQHLTPYPVPPVVFTPGVYLPGPFGYGYGTPYYPNPYYHGMSTSETDPYRRQVVAPRGGLVLQTIPDMAQVFVDGYYVGLAEEFGLHGRAMDISAGTHRIELRAAGYETLAFSVIIAPNDIVRYRGDMVALSAKPAMIVATAPPATAPRAPKSFYVIPNCYAGDKPPSGTLPKGCDVKKLQTRK